MNQQRNSDTYVTSDLVLATTISLQFPIQDIDRSNPRKAVFVFMRSPELENLVEGYFRNEIKISLQTFFNQLRDIKSPALRRKKSMVSQKLGLMKKLGVFPSQDLLDNFTLKR